MPSSWPFRGALAAGVGPAGANGSRQMHAHARALRIRMRVGQLLDTQTRRAIPGTNYDLLSISTVKSSVNREGRAGASTAWCIAGPGRRRRGPEYAGSQPRRRVAAAGGKQALEPGLLEGLAGRILRFGDAVAIEQQQIAVADERVDVFIVGRVEHPERDAGPAESLDGAVGAAKQGRVLPGVHVGQRACRR